MSTTVTIVVDSESGATQVSAQPGGSATAPVATPPAAWDPLDEAPPPTLPPSSMQLGATGASDEAPPPTDEAHADAVTGGLDGPPPEELVGADDAGDDSAPEPEALEGRSA
ncbi:MAG: hypothetical protein L0H96_04690 [Humibacillus sp.]|nr:hypothetical protein [Humibacillus sp.]MDN5776186.1 hypothetical protein [Humibacillus sp.]